MRLLDLAPNWIRDGGRLVGIWFACPCSRCEGRGTNLAIRFSNPVGGGDPTPNDPKRMGNNKGRRWNRTGETFDTLSLDPSIDATKDENGGPLPPEAQHWHGFISGGGVS